jgi:two-component system response regulator (stage 0 sporulation protein A)
MNELVVSNYLKHLGIPASINGYYYLRSAILIMLADNKFRFGITKILYPQIAKEYNTTASRVERGIRHAIEKAWNNGDMDFQNKIFKYSLNIEKGKPTNREFITTVVDYILLHKGEYNE